MGTINIICKKTFYNAFVVTVSVLEKNCFALNWYRITKSKSKKHFSVSVFFSEKDVPCRQKYFANNILSLENIKSYMYYARRKVCYPTTSMIYLS
jgi:hypothetical protein